MFFIRSFEAVYNYVNAAITTLTANVEAADTILAESIAANTAAVASLTTYVGEQVTALNASIAAEVVTLNASIAAEVLALNTAITEGDDAVKALIPTYVSRGDRGSYDVSSSGFTKDGQYHDLDLTSIFRVVLSAFIAYIPGRASSSP